MKMARLIDGTKKLQVVVVDVEVLGLLICEISFGVRSLKKTFTFYTGAEQMMNSMKQMIKKICLIDFIAQSNQNGIPFKKKISMRLHLLKGSFFVIDVINL